MTTLSYESFTSGVFTGPYELASNTLLKGLFRGSGNQLKDLTQLVSGSSWPDGLISNPAGYQYYPGDNPYADNIWLECPAGWFIQELYRFSNTIPNGADSVNNLQAVLCAAPNNVANTVTPSYADCYNEDISNKLNQDNTWATCTHAGYYVAGIFKAGH